MQTVLIIAEAAGEAFGSVAAAALLCWLLWDAFRLVRHPGSAAGAILIVLALALAGKLPHSEFLDMALAFAAIGAVPLWLSGRAWRREHRHDLDSLHRDISR